MLKVAATDPVSRQTGSALGLYEREVRFYRDIAPRLRRADSALLPRRRRHRRRACSTCCSAMPGPRSSATKSRGATTEQARLGVTELGRLHGPLLGDASLAEAPWLNREAPLNQAMIAPLYAGFIDRYGDQIAPEHRVVCERLVAAFDGYLASRRRRRGPDAGPGAR